jgi:hypothetical protein
VEDTEPAGNGGKREISEENRTTSSEDEHSTVLGFLKVKSCFLLRFSVNCMKFHKHADAVLRDCMSICGVSLELKFIRVRKDTKV